MPFWSIVVCFILICFLAGTFVTAGQLFTYWAWNTEEEPKPKQTGLDG